MTVLKSIATVQQLNGDKEDAGALRATWEKSFGVKAALGTGGAAVACGPGD
jgi:hypothetical protein